MYFLFHALHVAVRSASSTVLKSQDNDSGRFTTQLTSYLLLYVQEIVRSGNLRMKLLKLCVNLFFDKSFIV